MAWSNCSISESMSEEFIFRSTLNWRGHELARDRPAHPLLFPPQEIHSTAVGRATIARNHDRLCLFWTFLRRISSFHFAKWKCSPHSPPIAPVRLSIDGACFYCAGRILESSEISFDSRVFGGYKNWPMSRIRLNILTSTVRHKRFPRHASYKYLSKDHYKRFLSIKNSWDQEMWKCD